MAPAKKPGWTGNRQFVKFRRFGFAQMVVERIPPMQSTFRAVLGGALFVAAGCQSFAPYGQGAAYPSGYPAPGPTSGAYVPQGAVIAAPMQGMQTQAPAWQPQAAGAPSQVGSTQPREIPLASATPPAAQKLVPDYPDVTGSPAKPITALDDAEGDDFQRPVASKGAAGARLNSLIDDSEENRAAMGDESFSAPVPFRNASASAAVTGKTPNPYDYDRKNYTWVRGIVGFDNQDRSWFITYDNDPLGKDPYGGKLTLVEDDKLDALLANDVMFFEGAVDPEKRDRFGKPKYRIQKALRLVPKGE